MDHAKTTISHLFGEMVWLLSRSPVYKRMPISDLEWMVMSPIMMNQCRVFRKDTQPIGFALWAYLSDEVEARLMNAAKNNESFKLAPGEWKSGDNLWLIELFSPFHTEDNQLTSMMLEDVTKNVFMQKKFKLFKRTNKVNEVR